jgi:3-oxoadipate enol-lactonase
MAERCLPPVARATVVTPRGRLDVAYRRSGAGARHTLLLLHGIGSNSRSFSAQLAGLGGEFDVVAWDAPGYADSADPPANFSMADFAESAAGLLAALGWRRAHIVGHSFGGVIAQVLYQRHPESVRSLVLADTNAGSGTLPEPERSERIRRRLSDLETLNPRDMAERRAPNLVPPDAPAGLLQELIDVMAQIRPAGYAAAALAMGTADTRDQLARIDVPTLVLHGERDAVIPASTGTELAAAIPGARLVIIPGAGHASNQQTPGSYNQAIRDFVEAIG